MATISRPYHTALLDVSYAKHVSCQLQLSWLTSNLIEIEYIRPTCTLAMTGSPICANVVWKRNADNNICISVLMIMYIIIFTYPALVNYKIQYK